jgi:Uma2 family endonuclease
MDAMDQPVSEDGHLTAKQYFAMAECGIISPDERVELLDGLIVAMPPQSPWHAATISRIEQALRKKLGPEVYVRIQTTFPLDENSVPEPDLAVVPGNYEDYYLEHPTDAHLFIEVAHTSVLQDRITKAAIYARRGIPCYWLINLRDRCVEVFREPDRWKSSYTSVVRFTGSGTFGIDAFPGIEFEADELLPPPRLP